MGILKVIVYCKHLFDKLEKEDLKNLLEVLKFSVFR